ncbi:MAG: low specificity L-threonine aldolase [Candidatus Korarchaeota archaeon]|nr:low specificity L-threonine aldolase [Candidatus Korarchaeota archaeon]NIU82236.1 aminotransferase class I/II-fold pyridoxal phosphate-dependent enzyme [Candidatus Thorarchaeota archaeon]NIW12699.1 aminotransferase class I/II-fold pyridoxal phosphate-dependent enzyme [Candidatus Thorarchaeota archaeon]NIW50906.1 aminotransferase class I/II-fold pyridoxal phosphate-dependent enzyme [Candidatus Korarchaeota archaeon]
MNKIIDLRSDTVTLPTKEMREAMKNAELGDDVFQEDPTVNKLEDLAAQKLGMERALLVTSGTQGNVIAITTHTNRGQEVIVEAKSHIYNYEVGAMGVIAHTLPRVIDGEKGFLPPEQIEKAIRSEDVHAPRTGLICVEDTHNMEGGVIITPQQLQSIKKVADQHNIPVYLDGARIFNAAVALDTDVKEFTQHVDSMMVCLSKGLSAPVGSILAGSKEFIHEARRIRKMLGGGMRQAGIIAAPGIVALEKMIPRLAEDHRNAHILAELLNAIDGIHVDMDDVQTNIVMAKVDGLPVSPETFVERMADQGIKFLALPYFPTKVRLVTHRGITKEDVEYVAEQIRTTVQTL